MYMISLYHSLSLRMTHVGLTFLGKMKNLRNTTIKTEENPTRFSSSYYAGFQDGRS